MTDFTNSWDWPQWTWLILAFLSLLINTGSHGKPRDPHNGFVALLSFGLVLFILIAGGFFA